MRQKKGIPVGNKGGIPSKRQTFEKTSLLIVGKMILFLVR